MKFNAPKSERIRDIFVIYCKNEQVQRYQAYKNNIDEWVLDIENIEFDWYALLVNDSFFNCDAVTTTAIELDSGLYATIAADTSAYTAKQIELISVLCSQMDNASKPANRTSLFSKNDPFVIVAFQISAIIPETVVISIEWVYNGDIYFLASKPYMIDQYKNSFGCLLITPETPIGKWTCNLYVDGMFKNSHPFEILNQSSNISPKAGFIDIRF